jgi:hypothetical protein
VNESHPSKIFLHPESIKRLLTCKMSVAVSVREHDTVKLDSQVYSIVVPYYTPRYRNVPKNLNSEFCKVPPGSGQSWRLRIRKSTNSLATQNSEFEKRPAGSGYMHLGNLVHGAQKQGRGNYYPIEHL